MKQSKADRREDPGGTSSEKPPETRDAYGPITGLRFAVWRPSRVLRPLSYYAPSKATTEARSASRHDVSLDHSLLLEEVYAWDPGDIDPFGSLQSSEVVETFRSELMDKFSPLLPPDERSIAEFKSTVGRLSAHPKLLSFTKWTATSQERLTPSGAPIAVSTNTILALLEHLAWIANTFENVPHASVSIR